MTGSWRGRQLALGSVVLLVGGGCTAAPSSREAPPPPRSFVVPSDPALRDCAPDPGACGFPDSETTGTTGVLSVVDGPLVVDEAGTVVADVEVHGSIEVEADDVTLRNVRVVADGNGWGIALRHANRTTIEHCEIAPAGDRLMVGIKDIYGDAQDTEIRACDIARTTTGVQLYGGVIEDSYIHDLAHREGDHLNGITSNGATTPLVIRHNTVLNQLAQTDAIGLFQDFGVEANRVITGNLLGGGSYTMYGGEGDHGSTSGIVIAGNRFARTLFHSGGEYGPVAHFRPAAPATSGRTTSGTTRARRCRRRDREGHPAASSAGRADL